MSAKDSGLPTGRSLGRHTSSWAPTNDESKSLAGSMNFNSEMCTMGVLAVFGVESAPSCPRRCPNGADMALFKTSMG